MKQYQHTMEIWELLTSAAQNHKIYTYGEVADILDGLNTRGVGKSLDPIMKLCEKEGYPPLAELVVLKATGIPGHKLEMTKKEIDSIHEEIFKYDWSAIKPQIEDFRKADEEKL